MSRTTVIIKNRLGSTSVHVMSPTNHARFVALHDAVQDGKSSLEVHTELLNILDRTVVGLAKYYCTPSVAFDIVKTIVEEGDSLYSEYNKFVGGTLQELSELKKEELIELLIKCVPRSTLDAILSCCLNDRDIKSTNE